MSKRFILLVTLTLFFLPSILSLGISPATTNIEFTPGLTRTVYFTVVNSEQRDLSLVLSAQGELEEYISFQNSVIEIASDEVSREVSYEVRLPQELSPGSHSAEIFVVQLPESFVTVEEMSVGAVVAVLSELNVNVPYPGKYADGNFNVIGPQADGTVQFVLSLNNRGEFDIVKAAATIDIYSSLNEKVASVNTNEIGLLSKQRGELVAQWDSRSLPSGIYLAKANVVYDEKTFSSEKQFSVGRQRLNIQGMEVNNFKLGEIAKFEILVDSEWSETIKDAFAEMVIYSEGGNVLATFKSQNYDFEPLENKLMVAFWDSAGARTGTYDASIFLKYGGASDRKDISLIVSDDSVEIIGFGYVISKGAKDSKTLTYVLIGVIVLLVIANLSWFLLLRKKIMKK